MSRSVRRHLGQLITAGFSGTAIPADLHALAREFDLGGTILFTRNVEAPLQVAEVAYEAKRLGRELPPWVAIDQEGGRVQRLRAPCTEWPPVASLGRGANESLTERFGRALARELRILGITFDCAPVLDVNTNPRNPVIGDRALSDDPEQVADLGAIIVRTLQQEGVAACGKHFPGHGDTGVDSHADLPVVDHEPGRLEHVELHPFRAAIRTGVAAIMTAHVRYPAWDETSPATLARPIVTGLLRQELGFGGLIVSDDMAMGAIAKHHAATDAAVAAVNAGCDVLMLCAPDPAYQVAVIEGLIHAVEAGVLPERRIEDALRRQRRTKERFLTGDGDWRPPPPWRLEEVLGCAEHQQVAEEMRSCLQ